LSYTRKGKLARNMREKGERVKPALRRIKLRRLRRSRPTHGSKKAGRIGPIRRHSGVNSTSSDGNASNCRCAPCHPTWFLAKTPSPPRTENEGRGEAPRKDGCCRPDTLRGRGASGGGARVSSSFGPRGCSIAA